MSGAAPGRYARLAWSAGRSLLSRRGIGGAPMPMNVTFSVTNRCQSGCRTCLIWRLYRDEPERVGQELSIDEIRRLLASMGPAYFFNVSGGEPFLRDELGAIVELACRHLRPAIVHVPTNAIAVKRIIGGVEEILERMARVAPFTVLTLKPSLDGIGQAHDEIRGAAGNFARLGELLRLLEPLRARHPNLKVGLGTVISSLNVERLEEIGRFAEQAGVDSYISEIAEERSEMFNRGTGITPDDGRFAAAMAAFKAKTARMLASRRGLSRVTLAFRLSYYDLALAILRERRQVLPCYAGWTNVHLSPYGDVWPCCVRGYDGSFGNVREAGYDFGSVWRSRRASEVRRSIAREACACPLANQAYANMLLSPRALAVVAGRLIGAGRAGPSGGPPGG